MKRKHMDLLMAMVLAVGLFLVTGSGCAAKKQDKPAEEAAPAVTETVQVSRFQKLQSDHQQLIEKRQQWIQAMQTLDKMIIKLEGQIEEQQWIEQNNVKK